MTLSTNLSPTVIAPKPNEGTVDGVKLAQGAIALMGELADVMNKEADILQTHQFTGHAELLKHKQHLTLNYRTMMKDLAAQPDLLKTVPELTRAQIRQAAQRLADMTDRNARVLRASVVGAQQLLQSVVRMVKTEALAPLSYSNPTTQHMQLGTYSPKSAPVVVNRSA